MDFRTKDLAELEGRGFFYQCTDAAGLDELAASGKPIIFYVGFDPTGKSLHVGHLLWIKLVNELQNRGWRPIVVVGGATSKIGDPSGKDAERAMLSAETVAANGESILKKLKTLIRFGGAPSDALLLDNNDWNSRLNYMDFLRDFGTLFSINSMLTVDSIRSRLERQQHLSLLEFSYITMQAYDFLHLFETHGCVLQIGGADQWSNITFGVDLIRRKTKGQAFGFTMPLLTTSTGKKMGKTENGAIWLDAELTNPFDFWQYWRNVDDDDVARLLKLFTNVEPEEAEAAGKLAGTPAINDWKIRLADEIMTFVHPGVDAEQIRAGATGNGCGDYPTFEFSQPISLDEALVAAKLAESKSAAKRLIDGKGVKVDGKIATDYRFVLTLNTILSVGKKKFARIVVGQ